MLVVYGGLFVHLGKNWERFWPLHRFLFRPSRTKQFTNEKDDGKFLSIFLPVLRRNVAPAR